MDRQAADSISTLLIVDDDADNREALGAVLAGGGYRLLYARNGGEALALLEQQPVDLVLLDVMMPIMDGYETCRRIRASRWVAEVPVLMVTTLNDRRSRLQGIEAGADDFISKPVDPDELEIRVRAITRLNRYRLILQQADRLSFLETHDSLTRLPNRARLERLLDERLTGAGESFAILRIGLECFEQVNARFGIGCGDQLIQEVAARTVATVPRQAQVARLEGAQLGVLLPPREDPADHAEALTQRLDEVLGEPYRVGGQSLVLQPNFGVAVAESRSAPGMSDTDAESLLAQAANELLASRALG